MLTICYSPKGGQGCTTVAVALACATPDAILIDTAGDAPAAAGIPAPSGPGVCDLLASDQPVTADVLDGLTVGAPGLSVIPAGYTPAHQITAARWTELATALGALRPVIVDAATDPDAAAMPADRRIMVVQACYLALRRAVTLPLRPDQIVLVADHHRALTERDVEATLGTPTATVALDPRVARAIDAGLLTARMPTSLTRSLRPLATPAAQQAPR